MRQRTYSVELPPADRPFTAPVKTSVSAAILFSGVSDQSLAPHPSGQQWSEPLLDDRPGAGQVDPELSSRIDENWHAMWDSLTSEVGVSVPHSVDFPQLMFQRQMLVKAVVMGRSDLVDKAIEQGADPNALVPVKHPNQLPDQAQTFVSLPVGVAATMLYQRYEATARREGVMSRPDVVARIASYKRIAQKLLFNEHEDLPTVKVGTSADGVGTSLSFYAWGIESFAKQELPSAQDRSLAGMTLVRHNEPINLSLSNALMRISQDLMSDRRILPQESGNNLLGHVLSTDQALDSMAHLRRLELGQKPLGSVAANCGKVSPSKTLRSSKIAVDYQSGPESSLDPIPLNPPARPR